MRLRPSIWGKNATEREFVPSSLPQVTTVWRGHGRHLAGGSAFRAGSRGGCQASPLESLYSSLSVLHDHALIFFFHWTAEFRNPYLSSGLFMAAGVALLPGPLSRQSQETYMYALTNSCIYIPTGVTMPLSLSICVKMSRRSYYLRSCSNTGFILGLSTWLSVTFSLTIIHLTSLLYNLFTYFFSSNI